MKITQTAAFISLLATPGLLPSPVHADPTPIPSASSAPTAEEKPTVTKSGLEYKEVKVGTGAMPKDGQTVVIAYDIQVGAKLIESRKAGTPFEFKLGRGQALKGLEEGVSTMKVGGQRKLRVPPALGYGAEANAKVPANSDMIIDVELLEVR